MQLILLCIKKIRRGSQAEALQSFTLKYQKKSLKNTHATAGKSPLGYHKKNKFVRHCKFYCISLHDPLLWRLTLNKTRRYKRWLLLRGWFNDTKSCWGKLGTWQLLGVVVSTGWTVASSGYSLVFCLKNRSQVNDFRKKDESPIEF